MQDEQDQNRTEPSEDGPRATARGGGRLRARRPRRPDTRRVKKRHFAWAFLVGLSGFAAACVVGFFLLIDRDVTLPVWVQETLEAKLSQAVPELDISVGKISLRIEGADYSPRVFLQNVSMHDETGLPFATLGELSVRASFVAALKGQFLPKKVNFSGALVKLRRDSNGQFDLTIGNALQAADQAPSVAELIEGLDTLLVLPELQYLTEVQASSLTVLYEDARVGRAWTVDGGRMRIIRRGDDLSIGADFALLGGQDYATTLELSYDSAIGSPAARMGLVLADAPAEDIAGQTPALAWLEPLRAPISGAVRTEVGEDGALGPLNATLTVGKGVVQPEDELRPIPFESAKAYVSFDPKTQVLAFDELSVQSAWVEARAEGRARLVLREDGWPEALLGQLKLTSIRANPLNLYPELVSLDAAEIDMRLVLDPFRLDIGQLVVRNGEHRISAQGKIDIGETGWRTQMDARAESLPIAEVLRLWPESAKTKTRTWIETNILGGRISNARMAFRAEEGKPPQDRPRLYLSFDYADAKMRFMKTMPPVEQARGYVQMQGPQFLAYLQSGIVRAPLGGTAQVGGTSFIIDDTRIKQPPARVHLALKSTVTAALSLLDQKPFEVLRKAGQAPQLADGQVALDGEIALTLKKKIPQEEIDFDVAAKLTSVRSDVLVRDHVLAADELIVHAKSDQVTISGNARIDAVPVSGRWQMPIGKPGAGSVLTGQIELSERFVDSFNIGLPPGSVAGKGRGDIAINLKKGAAPSFALTSDLAGVRLRIDALGWAKPAGRKAALTVRGVLGSASGAVPRVDRLTLEGAGLSATGKVSLAAGGTLKAAEFDRVKVGSWLDAPVTLTGRGKGAAPGIVIKGGRVDMRGVPSGGGLGGAVPLDVSLDQLQVTKDITLTQFRGSFVSNRGLEGQFAASLNGKAAIEGRTTPRDGKSVIKIGARDAGAAISAAGLLKHATGGTLSLSLVPRATSGHYDGTLNVTNIRLQDAPPALLLLSAASGIGLLDQMGGQGLPFSEVTSSFRLTPQTVTIIEGSAVGAALGVSVDGFYDVASKRVDMQGVVSPFYAINGIGAIFTRKGEGLIGFNYTLDGPVSAPNVRVNPLSLFTPGMFREIFRRPPPAVAK